MSRSCWAFEGPARDHLGRDAGRLEELGATPVDSGQGHIHVSPQTENQSQGLPGSRSFRSKSPVKITDGQHLDMTSGYCDLCNWAIIMALI